MLHNDYEAVKTNSDANAFTRSEWMAILARASEAWLESQLAAASEGDLEWLRPAETGLMMVQGRAGGSGQRFNLGEVTVTRCVLKPDAARSGCRQVGVAYVMGGSHRHAQLAALARAGVPHPRISGSSSSTAQARALTRPRRSQSDPPLQRLALVRRLLPANPFLGFSKAGFPITLLCLGSSEPATVARELKADDLARAPPAHSSAALSAAADCRLCGSRRVFSRRRLRASLRARERDD
jgi:phosphonate C-P lyase system protein PhnG